MLKIGFTGTRHGMTKKQEIEFEKLIKAKKFKEFHHGMCLGSDEIAHQLIEKDKKNVNIIGHPPKWSGSVVQLPCHTVMAEDTYQEIDDLFAHIRLCVGRMREKDPANAEALKLLLTQLEDWVESLVIRSLKSGEVKGDAGRRPGTGVKKPKSGPKRAG